MTKKQKVIMAIKFCALLGFTTYLILQLNWLAGGAFLAYSCVQTHLNIRLAMVMANPE